MPARPALLDAESVREVQTLLKERGYDIGPLDGITGPLTRKAIHDYQWARSLPGPERPPLPRCWRDSVRKEPIIPSMPTLVLIAVVAAALYGLSKIFFPSSGRAAAAAAVAETDAKGDAMVASWRHDYVGKVYEGDRGRGVPERIVIADVGLGQARPDYRRRLQSADGRRQAGLRPSVPLLHQQLRAVRHVVRGAAVTACRL